MDSDLNNKREKHPKETANILSILTFFYSWKLFRKSAKKDLEEEDLYEVISTFRSKNLGNQLEREWENQKITNGRNSLVRLLWTCYGWEYLMIGLTQLVISILVILLQPHALGRLVAYFVPGQSELTKSDAWFYASILLTITFVNTVFTHNYYLILVGLGIQIKTAFCSFIYRKALKLDPTHLSDISIGKIVTLITKDVHAFEGFVLFANDLWIGIVKTAIICYTVYRKIGLSALVGVGFFLVIMPIQIFMGSLASKLRLSMCKKTDQRLQATQETLSAIRIIKMYTWERFFQNKIDTRRKKEISGMHKIFYLIFIILQIGDLNSKIAFYLLIMTYTWLGNHVTAEIVYFVLNCFQSLTHTMSILFPIGITQTATLVASMKRIGNVLKAMEIQNNTDKLDPVIKPRITMKEMSVHFKDKLILNGVSLNFEPGLNLLTGPVGCGKSFLLRTILQDFQPSKGGLITRGSISYASQEPWLFPSTIKQNIVFGENVNESRYRQVTKVCALNFDFQCFPDGDQTIVEDRGINLSKGQQTRINLARAVYRDSDIYLLDDCLAALDAHVSDYIFKECIMKFLKYKLVILVTHGTAHMNEFDNIVVLKNGSIKALIKPSDHIERENFDTTFEELQYNDKARTDELEDDDMAVEESELLTAETPVPRKVYKEVKQSGKVSFAVYRKYLNFGGGAFACLGVLVAFITAQLIVSYSDMMVSKWVNMEQQLANFSIHNLANNSDYLILSHRRDFTLNVYGGVMICKVIFSLLRILILLMVAKKASIKLHKFMVEHIVYAVMKFFDTNFIGNVLNRFSKDLGQVDEHLPMVIMHCLRIFFFLIGVVALIASVNTWFLIPSLSFFALLYFLRGWYLRTGRSMKRLDSATRSPVIGYLNATLEGLTTIRAFKNEKNLKYEFDRHQDLHTSAAYDFQSSMRAFSFCMDILCFIFISIIVVSFLIFDTSTLAGNVGMAITQAFLLTGILQFAVREWAEIENTMTSVERVLEYTEVDQESKEGMILENWPSKGEVKYHNVSLSYNGSKDYVLRNVNLTARSKEKIGIVGRTGAGKSSIISTLFRLYEVDGVITIDDVDTKTLSLEFLRTHISIIPQDPVLFAGTIRDNIDPTGIYNDEEVWKAIEMSNLKRFIPDLDYEITENGSNFSVGQRQLICMARAVIRNNKIIVLDEATANMDPETDYMIHETINKSFNNCTVFMIAHKLHSVLSCDKVVVMEKGEIIEFDEPNNLLNNPNGAFYKMVKKAKLLSPHK